MRILKINGKIADIDEKTAIGIDLQAYDFKEPGQLKVNVSNTFSIPATAHNRLLLGNAGSPHRVDDTIYQRINIDYQVRNTLYIKQGAARITSIKGGRINLFVAQRPGFIDEMKTDSFSDFMDSWFNEKYINPEFETFADFVDHYAAGTQIKLPLYFSNFYNSDTYGYREFLDDTGLQILLSTFNIRTVEGVVTGFRYKSNHFSIYIELLFRYIFEYYSIPFNEAAYTIFNDTEFKKTYIPFPNVYNPNVVPSPGTTPFKIELNRTGTYEPLEINEGYKEKTVYDFFITTLKLFGCGFEEVNGKYEVIRLDGIGLIGTSSDFLPGYMAANYKFENEYKPTIDNYGVNSLIKMKPFSDAPETLGARIVQSNNKNQDALKTIFTIDAHIPAVTPAPSIPLVGEAEGLNEFTYMQDSERTALVTVYSGGQTDSSSSNHDVTLTIPNIYTVATEYDFLDGVLQDPETRTIKRWVTASQLDGFRKIAGYYVPEFGAWYFVNKIKGFNPEKSKAPVEFELIKLPWVRMPQLPAKPVEISDRWILETGYWDDGGIWKDSEFWIDNI